MSWNYDRYLMCDRCGKMPLKEMRPQPSLKRQLAIARARGWLIMGELHYCLECQDAH
jgi:hypothetical protein